MNKRKTLITRFCLHCLLIMGLCQIAISAPVKITNITNWTGPENSQIAIYFFSRVSYTVTDLADKKGFVFNASNATYVGGYKTIEIKDGVVDTIGIQNIGNSCRITVNFMASTNYEISKGHTDRSYPVIEITRPENLRPARITHQEIIELKKTHKIIVIDPGHGGWHSGAAGNGLTEKNLTMELAKEWKEIIDAIPGYKCFLTRNLNFNNGDYYVSLTRRREMAGELGADLFISLHFNSPGRRSRRDVRGTEIYYLKYGDASDEEAQELADLENAADLDPTEVNKPGDILEELLMDERMISLNNQSSLLAGLVLNHMLKVNGFTDRGVKHARFAVLKCPTPAILVEIGFVTNPHEARLIQNKNTREELITKMTEALHQYFTINRGRTASAEPTTANSTGLPELIITPQ